jgi:DNA-binding FadR family transcriptional regulator
MEVRRALDVLAIELACDRMTDEDIEKLHEACTNFDVAVTSKDTRQIAEADVDFHDIIVLSTNNSRLIQLVNNLSEQMYRYRFEYLKDDTTHETLKQEHLEMYQSIVRKDKVTAAKAVRQHIDNQEKAIIKQLKLDKMESNV